MDPRLPVVAMMLCLPGCTRTVSTTPSLAPRTAEAIDPRVPIPSSVPTAPVTPALALRLAELTNRARAGDAAFQAAASHAERLAAVAGTPPSESWVAAQQALSAALAAREPVTRALGDIDALAASTIAERGGIAASDFAAIEQAASRVAAIDRSQAERLDALQARLGS